MEILGANARMNLRPSPAAPPSFERAAVVESASSNMKPSNPVEASVKGGESLGMVQAKTDRESLNQVVEQMNVRIAQQLRNNSVRFSVDSETGTVLVQVVDRETQEVIRQIPPEEIVALRERMAEMRGLLFDREG